jgi:hypothetical protein
LSHRVKPLAAVAYLDTLEIFFPPWLTSVAFTADADDFA